MCVRKLTTLSIYFYGSDKDDKDAIKGVTNICEAICCYFNSIPKCK